MTLYRQGTMGKRETRTPYRAVQCVLVAKASIFNSLIRLLRVEG